MSIKVKVKEAEIPELIKEGLYEAVVSKIEEETGDFGDYVRISFEISEAEYKGTVKNAVASKKLSHSRNGKTSKLYNFVKGITDVEPKDGEELDLEKLIGEKCKILVKNGQEKDGLIFQNVTEVMPA